MAATSLRWRCRSSEKPEEFLTVDQGFDQSLGVIEPAQGLSMASLLTRLIKDDRGVTAIEYGLILALIVIGSLVAINSVGLTLNLQTTFSTVAANL